METVHKVRNVLAIVVLILLEGNLYFLANDNIETVRYKLNANMYTIYTAKIIETMAEDAPEVKGEKYYAYVKFMENGKEKDAYILQSLFDKVGKEVEVAVCNGKVVRRDFVFWYKLGDHWRYKKSAHFIIVPIFLLIFSEFLFLWFKKNITDAEYDTIFDEKDIIDFIFHFRLIAFIYCVVVFIFNIDSLYGLSVDNIPWKEGIIEYCHSIYRIFMSTVLGIYFLKKCIVSKAMYRWNVVYITEYAVKSKKRVFGKHKSRIICSFTKNGKVYNYESRWYFGQIGDNDAKVRLAYCWKHPRFHVLNVVER